MSGKQIAGVIVILVGTGLMGVWIDRSFFHPTSADRKFIHNIADFGGNAATAMRPPASQYLMIGIGAVALGAHLVRK